MSVINNSLLLDADGYTISRSLRFNAADSAHLSRTVGTAGSQTTWTWAAWVKRTRLGAANILFSAGQGANNNTRIIFDSNDTIQIVDEAASVSTTLRATTAVYRDTSAWMHIVVAVDTTQATANNRVRLYVNGSEVTIFGTLNNPTLSSNLGANAIGTMYIGRNFQTNYLDAYLADVHFVNGLQLAASSFGQFFGNGVWMPKAYTGSYGTNGFELTFSDNSAATATTLGKDAAGSNDFTPNNFSASSAAWVPATDALSASIDLALPFNAFAGRTDVSPSIRGSGTAKTTSTNAGTIDAAINKYYGASFLAGAPDGSTRRLWSGSYGSFGSGDFCIETWFYAPSPWPSDAQVAIFFHHGGANTGFQILTFGSSGGLPQGIYFSDGGGGNVTQTNSNALTAGAWNHVAVTRSGSTLRIFINGVSSATLGGTISGTFTYAGDASILNGSGATWNTVRLQDFRIYKGAAKYTANFTPPSQLLLVNSGGDSVVDSPTNGSEVDTGAGGQKRGNYCTWNPLRSNVTINNGNLDAVITAVSSVAIGSIAVSSGKYYWEVTAATANQEIGIANTAVAIGGNYPLEQIGTFSYYGVTGNAYPFYTAYGAPYTAGDIIGLALDMDAGTLTAYKNNVSQGTMATGLTGFWTPAVGLGTSSGSFNTVANFGQRPFAYTAPSGFKALCTANLPTPTISAPSTAMDVLTITGANQAYTGLNFSPDLLWFKRRNAVENHYLFDAVRGGAALLGSNTTAGDLPTGTTYISSFDSNGFTTANNLLTATATYVVWCWNESVSSGFDIVTYSNLGSVSNISHSLGVAPRLLIVKRRDTATNWAVWHASIPNTSYLTLNSAAASTTDTTYWNSTSPTSTTFTIGTNTVVNSASGSFVAYCFAPVAGYSAFDKYTGNGSADGPFIYTGFRPALVLVKSSSSATDWVIIDDRREGYNVDNNPLYPNLGSNEGTTDLIDITSNGFKVRSTNALVNTSAATYVFAAWAEHPFSIARAR